GKTAPSLRRSILEAARYRACASRTAGDVASCWTVGGHFLEAARCRACASRTAATVVQGSVWMSLRSRPPARAAAFTKRRICAWMDHLSIQEKVQELSGGLCKFRIRIERVRYAFKSVELHRHLHFPQFLEQTFATLDWDGHVRGSMEDDGRRRSLR